MGKPRVQVVRRKHDGECFFCGESAPEALECHRIISGAEGGRYDWQNIMTLCGVCHAKVTAGTIKVFARLQSTYGPVIHCKVDGEERFISEWKKKNL